MRRVLVSYYRLALHATGLVTMVIGNHVCVRARGLEKKGGHTRLHACVWFFRGRRDGAAKVNKEDFAPIRRYYGKHAQPPWLASVADQPLQEKMSSCTSKNWILAQQVNGIKKSIFATYYPKKPKTYFCLRSSFEKQRINTEIAFFLTIHKENWTTNYILKKDTEQVVCLPLYVPCKWIHKTIRKVCKSP